DGGHLVKIRPRRSRRVSVRVLMGRPGWSCHPHQNAGTLAGRREALQAPRRAAGQTEIAFLVASPIQLCIFSHNAERPRRTERNQLTAARSQKFLASMLTAFKN